MNLNDQINRAAHRATDAELSEALETIKAHVQYREELRAYGMNGGRLNRPAWAEPGRKRRGGHVS